MQICSKSKRRTHDLLGTASVPWFGLKKLVFSSSHNSSFSCDFTFVRLYIFAAARMLETGVWRPVLANYLQRQIASS